MKTNIRNCVLSGIFLCAGVGMALPVSAQDTPVTAVKTTTVLKYSEDQKVERLIQVISRMEGATFIRNGSEHTPKEAAEHLETKWEKHKADIRDARGFVDKLASRSGLTGEPYKIRFADGTEKTTNEVLMDELQRIEKE